LGECLHLASPLQGESIIHLNCDGFGYKPVGTALVVLAPRVEFAPTAYVVFTRSPRYVVVTATFVVGDVIIQTPVVTTRL